MLDIPAIAFVAAMCATPLAMQVLRRLDAIDQPNERSSHVSPTVRGGGVAVALGVAAGLAVGWPSDGLLPLLIVLVAFAAIGLVEDVHGISPLPRLALHLLAGVTSALAMVAPPHLPLPFRVGVAVVAGIWLAGFANLFNFMDGINGISATQGIIAGLAYSWLGRQIGSPALEAGGLAVVGGTAGFAPWNFPRARVFLGDVGSYALGALLAALAVIAMASDLPLEAVAGPLALYLGDTTTTLVRRIRSGEVWYLPHRSHAYQRLVIGGWSHTTVTSIVAALIVACSLLGFVSLTESMTARLFADCVMVSLVAAFCAAPLVRERIAGSSPKAEVHDAHSHRDALFPTGDRRPTGPPERDGKDVGGSRS